MLAVLAGRLDVERVVLLLAIALPVLSHGQIADAKLETHRLDTTVIAEPTKEPIAETSTDSVTGTSTIPSGSTVKNSQVMPPACSTAPLTQQNLPVVDASDIVAQQLRHAIADTSEETLRSKLSQAYLRYVNCI